MLNTIMALWNQDHSENRQKIGKVIFTILFISGSASLFLFTLNSSAWPPFAGAQGQRTKREEQPTMSNSRGIVIAGNTPVNDSGTVGITPTATTSRAKVTIQPPCIQASNSVVSPKATTRPQNIVTYSGKSNLRKGSSGWKHTHPKTVRVKKGKPHSRNRSQVKVIAPPVSQATETVPVAQPVLPIATPIIQPTPVPVATAEVIATMMPGDGTAASNVPAIVTTHATPDMSMTSTTQFISNLGQKRALLASASPLAKSGKKSSDKKNDHVHENVACSGSTFRQGSHGGTLLKAERHVGLLLGGSLLGALLSLCFVFVFRREG